MTRGEREVTLAKLQEKNSIYVEKRSWPIARLDQLLLRRNSGALLAEGLKVNRVRGKHCNKRREGGHLSRTAREGLDLRREAKLAGRSGSTVDAKKQ